MVTIDSSDLDLERVIVVATRKGARALHLSPTWSARSAATWSGSSSLAAAELPGAVRERTLWRALCSIGHPHRQAVFRSRGACTVSRPWGQ
jgi:hypothetical protein